MDLACITVLSGSFEKKFLAEQSGTKRNSSNGREFLGARCLKCLNGGAFSKRGFEMVEMAEGFLIANRRSQIADFGTAE